ncbi:hypothetical protein BCR36DRAFT_411711 [Piromyces finnis]|uniref:Uncharacterized protein n=1 Tax=Piromyces finnis TaxID=1754191 RepID=A0A1Y1VBA2_9FUNG|nr:hypothetical protein BCR36DRAFT_411711 [Piromyces finnis]|eukprot:ORX51735.1 hypothetical protein BCR36DRAFT_411711 [Piromyces finnis]
MLKRFNNPNVRYKKNFDFHSYHAPFRYCRFMGNKCAEILNKYFTENNISNVLNDSNYIFSICPEYYFIKLYCIFIKLSVLGLLLYKKASLVIITFLAKLIEEDDNISFFATGSSINFSNSIVESVIDYNHFDINKDFTKNVAKCAGCSVVCNTFISSTLKNQYSITTSKRISVTHSTGDVTSNSNSLTDEISYTIEVAKSLTKSNSFSGSNSELGTNTLEIAIAMAQSSSNAVSDEGSSSHNEEYSESNIHSISKEDNHTVTNTEGETNESNWNVYQEHSGKREHSQLDKSDYDYYNNQFSSQEVNNPLRNDQSTTTSVQLEKRILPALLPIAMVRGEFIAKAEPKIAPKLTNFIANSSVGKYVGKLFGKGDSKGSSGGGGNNGLYSKITRSIDSYYNGVQGNAAVDTNNIARDSNTIAKDANNISRQSMLNEHADAEKTYNQTELWGPKEL